MALCQAKFDIFYNICYNVVTKFLYGGLLTMKNNNWWNAFSRGLFVALLALAIFCGICALGAAFSNIPWLLLSGGICILLVIGAIVWFLGYLSRNVKNGCECHDYDIDDIEFEDDDDEYDEPAVQVVKQTNPQPQEPAAPQEPVKRDTAPKPAAQLQQRQQNPRRDISHFDMFPADKSKQK